MTEPTKTAITRREFATRAALAAETACKQTLTPEHAFCRQTLLALASRARTAARR